MKAYIEERAIETEYIVSSKAIVRETTKKYSISKSTVKKIRLIRDGIFSCLDLAKRLRIAYFNRFFAPSMVGGGAE